MANILSGVIKTIEPAQTRQNKAGQPYTTQRILLDCTTCDRLTGERSKYENIVPLEFFGDRANALAAFKAGDVVTVSFTVRGRTYQRKDTGATDYMASLDPYKIELRGASHSPAQALAQPAANYQQSAVNQQQGFAGQQPQPGFAPSAYPQQPAQPGYQNLPY